MNKLTGVRADSSYSHKKLEEIAAEIRKFLGYGPEHAIDPLRLFDDLGEIELEAGAGKVVRLGSGVVDLEDSEGYSKYEARSGRIEVLAARGTYAWLEERHPRATFFVAHELGHCLLHTDQLIRLAQMPTHQQAAFHRGLTEHRTYEDTEWQANAFASALLMPAQGLAVIEERYSFLSIPMIANSFQVSGEAAGIRLKIYKERKGELLRDRP